MNLSAVAPAKINLGLEIGKKRSDGYHNVEMIMQSVSLCDVIDIHISNSNDISIAFDKNINCKPENNTAFMAAREFLKYIKMSNIGLIINIKKNIPMQAGMAGGSADAAGVICGLNALLKCSLTIEEMCKIGGKIGSDVPFCIIGGTAYVHGSGTEIKKINIFPKCQIVIVKPDLDISTPEAYMNFDKLKICSPHNLESLKSAIAIGNFSSICKNLYNRFEEVMNEPEIFEIKKSMEKLGADGALMTGSGSAVYGLFQDDNCAKICFENMKKLYSNVYLTYPLAQGAYVM